MLLSRASKQVKTGRGVLDYGFDRHDLFWVSLHFMVANSEVLLPRLFPVA